MTGSNSHYGRDGGPGAAGLEGRRWKESGKPSSRSLLGADRGHPLVSSSRGQREKAGDGSWELEDGRLPSSIFHLPTPIYHLPSSSFRSCHIREKPLRPAEVEGADEEGRGRGDRPHSDQVPGHGAGVQEGSTEAFDDPGHGILSLTT